MEIAALEIARMSEEIDGLRAELLVEQDRRLELEARIESLAEREMEIEADVREQCYQEMEERFAFEMERWKARWLEEQDNTEAHMDRKLEILARLGEDEDKENSAPLAKRGVQSESEFGRLEDENEKLKREVEMLRREVQGKSPSKSQSHNQQKMRERMPLRESKLVSVERSLENLRIDGSHRGSGASVAAEDKRSRSSSPKKVVRKLGGRKWDLEDDIF
jgi:hypothetical protein